MVSLGIALPAETQELRGRDPILKLTYTLTMDGSLFGIFENCQGMGSLSSIEKSTVVGPSGIAIVEKSPGAFEYAEVECSRGVTSNMDTWNWRQMLLTAGSSYRKQVTITMNNLQQIPVAQWSLVDAWPAAVLLTMDTSSGQPRETEVILLVAKSITRTQ